MTTEFKSIILHEFTCSQVRGDCTHWTQDPRTEDPRTRGPKDWGPKDPRTQGPGTQGPGTQGPGTQGPGTQGPGTQGPGTQGPGTQGPGTQGPGTQRSNSVTLSFYDRNATCVNVLSSNIWLYCCGPQSPHCYTHSRCSSHQIVLFHTI